MLLPDGSTIHVLLFIICLMLALFWSGTLACSFAELHTCTNCPESLTSADSTTEHKLDLITETSKHNALAYINKRAINDMAWLIPISSAHSPLSRFRGYIFTIPSTFRLNDFYSMSFWGTSSQSCTWLRICSLVKDEQNTDIFLHFEGCTNKSDNGEGLIMLQHGVAKDV